MVVRAYEVICQTRWILEDGRSINFMLGSRIANLLLNRWPTFIIIEVSDSMMISDLLLSDSRGWNLVAVTRVFGDILGTCILSLFFLFIPVKMSGFRDSFIFRELLCQILIICVGRSPLNVLMLVEFGGWVSTRW